MAGPEPAIQRICNVMVRGNIALYNGDRSEAINRYNEVLYKLSPGHVCALLNRCLAFLFSGYSELAVMDAYRACLAAAQLGKVRPAVAILLTPELESAL